MNEIKNESGALTAEQQDAFRLDFEIKQQAISIASGICSIGKCLKEMKERRLYLQLSCESLEEYAEKAVGLKGRAAYNYISAYETYGEEGLKKYGGLGITKLAALAQLNENDRNELIENGKAEELSTRELQNEIKALKEKNEQLTFDLNEKTEEKSKSASELEIAQKEIDSLKAALEQEKRTKVLPAPEMSAEEKAAIRKGISEELEKHYEAEFKRAEKAAKEKAKADYTKKETAADEKITAAKEEITRLSEKLEAAERENNRLQGAVKPVPSGNMELLKYRINNVVTEFNAAAELIGRFTDEERTKCVERLKKAAEMIAEAAKRL